ncbi:MAG: hypothetical protein Q4A11_00675 [Brachymonas sp.]|nr:hypothetical protein [Brachymonas sp.]
MKLETLKEKARYLALAPVAALSVPTAFAGPLEAAANAAKQSVSDSQGDLVTILGSMLGLAVVIFVGMKIVGIFRRG